MEESEKIIRIEKYLRAELSETDRQQFEQQLEKDPDLAKTFAIEKEIFKTVQIAAEDRFRGRLSNIHQEERLQQAKVKPIYKRSWFLAASLLFLIGISWLIWQQNRSVSTQELFADYYTAPNFTTTRSDVAIDESVILAAETYQKKDYATTIQHLESYQRNNFDAKLALVIGACYLDMQRYTDAIATFETLRQQEVLIDDATWYLALTHLKANQKGLAKAEFERLLSGEFIVTEKRKSIVENILSHL